RAAIRTIMRRRPQGRARPRALLVSRILPWGYRRRFGRESSDWLDGPCREADPAAGRRRNDNEAGSVYGPVAEGIPVPWERPGAIRNWGAIFSGTRTCRLHSPPHDVDGEDATLVARQKIIDEVANNRIRL